MGVFGVDDQASFTEGRTSGGGGQAGSIFELSKGSSQSSHKWQISLQRFPQIMPQKLHCSEMLLLLLALFFAITTSAVVIIIIIHMMRMMMKTAITTESTNKILNKISTTNAVPSSRRNLQAMGTFFTPKTINIQPGVDRMGKPFDGWCGANKCVSRGLPMHPPTSPSSDQRSSCCVSALTAFPQSFCGQEMLSTRL